jgi:hypothetical protein
MVDPINGLALGIFYAFPSSYHGWKEDEKWQLRPVTAPVRTSSGMAGDHPRRYRNYIDH